MRRGDSVTLTDCLHQLRSLSIVTAELLTAGCDCRYQLSCPHNYRKNNPAKYLGNNADCLLMSGLCLSGAEVGGGGGGVLVWSVPGGRGEG